MRVTGAWGMKFESCCYHGKGLNREAEEGRAALYPETQFPWLWMKYWRYEGLAGASFKMTPVSMGSAGGWRGLW